MTGQEIQDGAFESEAKPGNLEASESDLPLPSSAARIESWVRKIGHGLSWIWLILVAVIVLNVILRYALSEGHIELEEMQWHLYAAGFLGGLSLAVVDDRHVRVDFLRERMSPRLRAWIELYGLLLLSSRSAYWSSFFRFLSPSTLGKQARFPPPLEGSPDAGSSRPPSPSPCCSWHGPRSDDSFALATNSSARPKASPP